MSPRFSAIGLVSSDMARSLAFYRDLGLDVPADATADAPHVEVPLPGGLRLLLDPVETVRSFDPEWTSPTGSSRAGIALECDDPSEVDEVWKAMVAAGHQGHLEPWDAVWGQRYASLTDPDGNTVDLFAALPTDA
jgi:catechol 2,3-dioxygenase-like lactoylglutathione lyase family enzyme